MKYFIERMVEDETDIHIEKKLDTYYAIVNSHMGFNSQIECYFDFDYTLNVDTCDTESLWDAVHETFTNYVIENGIKYAHKCDKCKQGMNEGYYVNNGEEFYCSAECLHQVYTQKQWEEMYQESEEHGGNDNYWTQWEDEEDCQYVLFDEKLITIN
jgi:hypothetical protein